METSTTRPTIHCRACRRELYQLRRPRWLWCGAPISAEEYEAVAAPPRRVMDLPPSLPMVLGPMPAPMGWGAFPRYARHLSPWERKLQLAAGIIAGSVGLIKLAVEGAMAWHLHLLMQPLPPHP